MIRRCHEEGSTRSEAVYSPCERYRYALTRVWTPEAPRLMYVMLNPSTADERRNDPTVERCERRARALGYGAFRVTNLFAWRATLPADLRRASDPVGQDNDAALADGADWADAILASWGVHGTLAGRHDIVARALAQSGKPLLALGETRDGHPRHPLYVSYAVSPAPWPRKD